MSRQTRMYIPGIPTHVVQRGHNRNACFFADKDYVFYKEVLAEALRRYGASLHAYCLMSNHIHLLLTPLYEDSIQRVFQHMGRQYAQHINQSYRRTGALWEGRHKGSLVCEDNYLLACYRYIELNPVNAAMVVMPEDYRWSSYRANGCGAADNLLTPHQNYKDLGKTIKERCFAYRLLFQTPLADKDIHDIRVATKTNRWVGDVRFQQRLEKVLGRKLSVAKPGRPSLIKK